MSLAKNIVKRNKQGLKWASICHSTVKFRHFPPPSSPPGQTRPAPHQKQFPNRNIIDGALDESIYVKTAQTMFDPKAFLDHMTIPAYQTAVDGKYVYANQAMADLLGFPDPKSFMSAALASQFYSDQAGRQRWIDKMNSLQQGRIFETTQHWKRLDGSEICVVNCARVVKEKGHVSGYEGVIVDQQRHSKLIDVSPLGKGISSWTDDIKDLFPICISRKDLKHRVLWANKKFLDHEQITHGTLTSLEKPDEYLYGAILAKQYLESDQNVFRSGLANSFTERHPFKGGDKEEEKEVTVVKIPTFNESGQVNGLETYFWDSNLLNEEETRRVAPFVNSRFIVVYQHDMDGIFEWVNEGAQELTGRSSEDWKGMSIADVVAPEYVDTVIQRIQQRGKEIDLPPSRYEIEILSADKQRRIPVEIMSRTVIENGHAVGVLGHVRDLTESKKAELERLREIHHRVKNNLHTVYLLLDNELQQAPSHETRQVLESCQARVLTMKLLHESLHQQDRVDRMDLTPYITKLVNDLVASYQRDGQLIIPRIQIESGLTMMVDTLVPCALVIQELIANSIKHAFPIKPYQNIRHGTVFVSLNKSAGKFHLTIADNGDGFPPRYSIEELKMNSLGMKLVYGLIQKQLGGTVSLSFQPNTAFDIEFSE
jgi:PAS domain S-box-containing protein